MYILIHTDTEYYDKVGELLISKNKKVKPMSLKKFIKDTSQIESEVEKHIKKLTKSAFDPLKAEAHSSLYSSMIYHHPKEKEHTMFLIRVEHMGKKIEFKDYYLSTGESEFTRKNKEQM